MNRTSLWPAKAKLHNVSVDQVHIVCYCDFNHPQASAKARVSDLARLFQSCCEIGPTTSVGIADMPEVVKASSKRGLADEENDIQVAFWGQKMNIDTRFILAYDLPAAGEALTKRRWEWFGWCCCSGQGCFERIKEKSYLVKI